MPRKLIIGLVLIGLIALLPGRWREAPLQVVQGYVTRALLSFRLDGVPGISSEAMDVDLAADGGVWVASKYGVARIAPGETVQAMLSRDQLRTIGGGRIQSLATVYAESAEDFWVGGWHGAVARVQGGQIQIHSSREESPRGRITDILRHDDRVYVASSQGLFRLEESAGSLVPVTGFESARVVQLEIGPAGELLVATERALHSLLGTGWVTLWERGAEDAQVTALCHGVHGEILLGTKRGFWVLDSDGNRRSHELPASWITAFADRPEGRWVGTWQQGFMLPAPEGWRPVGFAQGLPKDSVSDFAIDSRGRIWMALYGGGGQSIDAAELVRLASAIPRPVLDDTAREFADACAAAEALGIEESGQVRQLRVDGRGRVFFLGRMVCPDAPGHSPNPEQGLWLAGDQLQHWRGGITAEIPLPERLAPGNVSSVLLAADGAAWIGTRFQGVFRFSNGQWETYGREVGLAGNPIQALDEDASGQLWLASSPRFNRQSGGYNEAGLHRWDGQQWQHWEPTGDRILSGPGKGRFRSLAGHTVNDVRVLADGTIAAATNGGLSLYDGADFRSFNRYNPGLSSGFIASVVPDADQRLWLTHLYWGAGVSWRAGLIFRNVNSRDGLFADRIRTVAHDGEDRIWVLDHIGRVGLYRRERLLN